MDVKTRAGEPVLLTSDELRVILRANEPQAVAMSPSTVLGRYEGQYVATRAGFVSVEIEVNGAAIVGSPWQVAVAPAEAYGPSCFVKGQGQLAAFLGHEASFEVVTYDRFDNRIHLGGAAVIARISNGMSSDIALAVHDNGDGMYRCAYIASVTGAYTIEVGVVRSEDAAILPVAGSPFQVYVDGPPAVTCIASGIGIERCLLMETTELTIQCRTASSKPACLPPQDTLVVFIREEAKKGTAVSRADVKLVSMGEYMCSYKARFSGWLTLSVLHNDTHTLGSPFRVSVIDGLPFPASCTAKGLGTHHATVGTPAEFEVQLNDRFGNIVLNCPRHVAAVAAGKHQMVEAVVKSLSDGKYAASYVTSQAGEYTLVVTVQGQDILGSPFHVLSCSDEVTCVADGAGLTQAIVGETSHFSATLKFVSELSEGRLPTKDVCILICEEKTKNPVEFETAIYETMNQTRFAVSYEPQLCTNLLITIQFRYCRQPLEPSLHCHDAHLDEFAVASQG